MTIEEIEQDFRIWMKWNCSTMFLMKPVVGLGIGDLSNYGLINSYLYEENKDGDLFVLFRPAIEDAVDVLIAIQSDNNKNFITDHDYPGGYVALAYNIPEDMTGDFNLFKQGRYSEMSEMFKKHHEKTVIIESQKRKSFQYNVLYKDPELRRSLEMFFETKISARDELWSIPDKNKETLDIIKIQKEHERNTDSNKEAGKASTTNKRFLTSRNTIS